MDETREGQLIEGRLVDQDGMIHRDVPCQGCGYNLRTLHATSRCPECNAEAIQALVLRSEEGTFLRFCNPQWLGTLRLGVVLILCGHAVPLLAFLSVILIPSVWGVGFLLIVVGDVLRLAGRFCLTSTEPCAIGADSGWSLPNVVRGASALGLMDTVLWGSIPLRSTSASIVYLLAVAALFLVERIGTLAYLRRLAIRLHNPKLVSSAGILIWGWAICACLVMCAIIQFTYSSGWLQVIGIPIGVIAGGVLIWYVALMFRFLSRLADAERYSSALGDAEPLAAESS